MFLVCSVDCHSETVPVHLTVSGVVDTMGKTVMLTCLFVPRVDTPIVPPMSLTTSIPPTPPSQHRIMSNSTTVPSSFPYPYTESSSTVHATGFPLLTSPHPSTPHTHTSDSHGSSDHD